jgi:arabinofuranosyltransferase
VWTGAIDRTRAARALSPQPATVVGARRPWGLQRLVLVAPVVLYAGAAWAHRYIVEDGFIYLRVVRMLRLGHGPVFNDGERVEAYTGPLWVALLAVADLVTPVRLEWIAVVLGLALAGTGVALAIAGSARLVRISAPDARLVPAGILVFIALLPAWVFGTGGLETGLVFAWTGSTLFVLCRWAGGDSRLDPRFGLLFGLGWLVRPELALVTVALVLVVVLCQWPNDSLRTRLQLVGATVALPLAYQFFRMGYFGSLVANTAVAKEATGSNWERGWHYLLDFANPYWLWVPAVALLLGGYLPIGTRLRSAGRSRAFAVMLAFATTGLLLGLYVVYVGGDYIHGRLLLPALFTLCAPVAVVPLTRRCAAALVVLPWAAVAALGLRPPQVTGEQSLVDGVAFDHAYGKVTIDQFGWGEDGPQRAWYTDPGLYGYFGEIGRGIQRADVVLPPGTDVPVAAIAAVGIAGYSMGDVRIIDLHGLADPFTAHMNRVPLSLWPRLAGHEKVLTAPWLAARLWPHGGEPPAAVVTTGIPTLEGQAFREQVAWARAALQCPDVRRMLDAATASLSVERFGRNLLGAISNAGVRIPIDPREAYEKFCGPGVPVEVRSVRSRPASAPNSP